MEVISLEDAYRIVIYVHIAEGLYGFLRMNREQAIVVFSLFVFQLDIEINTENIKQENGKIQKKKIRSQQEAWSHW